MSKRSKKKRRPAPGVELLEDGRYRIRVKRKDRMGRPIDRRETLPQGTSLGQAVDARVALEAQIEDELLEVGDHKQMPTLRDFSVSWIATKTKRCKRHTVESYAAILAHHVLPSLGGLLCCDIRRSDVQGWVADMEAKDIARSTGIHYWNTGKAFIQDAAAEFGLSDPCWRVKPPRCKGGKAQAKGALTMDETQAILAEASREGPQRHCEIVVLLDTGLRASELCGIEWRDVDTSKCTINVRAEVAKQGKARVVVVRRSTAKLLQQWRITMTRQQHPGLPSGLVFPAMRKGGRQLRNAPSVAITRLAQRAGIQWRVSAHDLRRTLNSMGLEGGWDRAVLRAQTGHSGDEMTDLYAYLRPEARQEKLEEIWGESVTSGCEVIQKK